MTLCDFGKIKLSSLHGVPLKVENVDVKQDVVLRFSLINDLGHEVSLKEVKTSCGCAKGGASSGTAKPLDEMPFEFRLTAAPEPKTFSHEVSLIFKHGTVGFGVLGAFSHPFEIEPAGLKLEKEGSAFVGKVHFSPSGNRSKKVLFVSPVVESVPSGITCEVIESRSVDNSMCLKLGIGQKENFADSEVRLDFNVEYLDGSSIRQARRVSLGFGLEGVLRITPRKPKLKQDGDVFFGKVVFSGQPNQNISIAGMQVNSLVHDVNDGICELRKLKDVYLLVMRVPSELV